MAHILHVVAPDVAALQPVRVGGRQFNRVNLVIDDRDPHVAPLVNLRLEESWAPHQFAAVLDILGTEPVRKDQRVRSCPLSLDMAVSHRLGDHAATAPREERAQLLGLLRDEGVGDGEADFHRAGDLV